MREIELINIEFYQEPKGGIMVQLQDRELFLLEESRREFIVPMKQMIQNDYPDAWRACEDWNKPYRHNILKYDFLNVRRFCKCNFPKFDGILDIDAAGCMHFEFTDCPMRGECKYENLLCSPVFSHTLTKSDVQLLKLIAAEQLTAEEIALQLGRSVSTINNRRKVLQKKTSCNTISKLVAYCYTHRLIE